MIVTVKIVALVKTDNNQYGWLIEQSLEKCKNIVGDSTFLFVETKTLPIPIKIKDGKYIDLCDSEWHIVRKNHNMPPQEYDTTQKESFRQIEIPEIPEE